nr:hypothetical protein [Candidatus Gastranaerophilales bacterium]
ILLLAKADIIFLIIVFGATLILGFMSFYFFSNIKNLSEVKQEIKNSIGKRIINQATNALGIDIEQCKLIKPVIMHGDAYSNIFNQYAYNMKDDFTSNYSFLVLLFSENQLFYYIYTFSLISDEENITSGEFFYKDVVAFKTESKKVEITLMNNTKTISKTKIKFTLMTTGGNAFEMIIKKKDEEKIQGMRQLLREKKNAMN